MAVNFFSPPPPPPPPRLDQRNPKETRPLPAVGALLRALRGLLGRAEPVGEIEHTHRGCPRRPSAPLSRRITTVGDWLRHRRDTVNASWLQSATSSHSSGVDTLASGVARTE